MGYNTIKTKFFNNSFVLLKIFLTKDIIEIFSDLEEIKKIVQKKSNIIIYLQMGNLIPFTI